MEYVSIIRAITLPLVPTSGAGIMFLRPDDNADLAGIAAGQTLQFTFRRERIDADHRWRRRFGRFSAAHLMVIHADRAITSLDQRQDGSEHRLCGHSGRGCAAHILRNDEDSAIIHLYRNIDDQSAFWVAQGIHRGITRPDKGPHARFVAGRYSGQMCCYLKRNKITYP